MKNSISKANIQNDNRDGFPASASDEVSSQKTLEIFPPCPCNQLSFVKHWKKYIISKTNTQNDNRDEFPASAADETSSQKTLEINPLSIIFRCKTLKKTSQKTSYSNWQSGWNSSISSWWSIIPEINKNGPFILCNQ